MKLAVITDTHAGIRNDDPFYIKLQKAFYDEVFFPACEHYGISTVLHLGDIVDRRKYINFLTLDSLIKDFLEPCEQRGFQIHLAAGNHDCYHKNSNLVNAPRLLFGRWDNMHIYDNDAVELEFDGLKIALVPWIVEENKKRIFKFLKNTTAQVCMGHFELNGFKFSRKGLTEEHGLDPNALTKFDVVASGHFHHGQKGGNVHYLGAPFWYDWGDSGDLRGFHIFDTETREFEFIPNPFDPYVKYKYDDTDMTLEYMLSTVDPEIYKGRRVMLIVTNKTNPYIYDLVVDKLEETAYKVETVDDHLNADVEEDKDILAESEDTMTIVRNYIEVVPFGVDKKALERKMEKLYQAALSETDIDSI